ncbi:hypothetical protein FSP39_020627 [Pinctada imbricata]|uniref:Nodal modulator 1 n=1 Tax=Pinctada imbricata TaxID=66713 RepID=A0AA88YE27_PINIB|nr:hypothetical protein FSP39_020627 [Pinctada imbricata]
MILFKFISFLYLTLSSIHKTEADGVLACGGFVKSDVEINFSLVEVKLYTSHGSIKYQTDCAPNTGYYLIPLYEKADFILKVEPPKGWSFEPESVSLKVDGSTDKCSLGEDINFKFTGFTLSGKVISKGKSDGPAGVTVSLHKAGSADILQSVTTSEGGSYKFTKVMPGDYEVKATSSDGFKFIQSTAKAAVSADNYDVGNSLVIGGYQVTGSVKSEGEAIKGVNFVLFSKSVPKEDVSDCEKSSPKGFTSGESAPLLCHVTSKEDGTFVYPSLPAGEYFIVPFYKGEHITFDVRPEKLDFTVTHMPMVLQKSFQVEGFSVKGRVVNSQKGSGINNAKIYINSKLLTSTGVDGTYHLENMKAGTYQIHVEVDNVYFDDLNVKITPNTPQLPDIVATGFSMCGKIKIDKVPEGLKHSPVQRRIIVYPEGKSSNASSVSTDADGAFCTRVSTGKYIIKVHLTEEESKAGLQLVPDEKVVTVQTGPVLDIVFTQFRAKLSGGIICLEKCGEMEVSLDTIGRSDQKQITKVKEGPRGTIYQFDNVMPGKYKVTLLHDTWCWKEKSVEVEVSNSDIASVDFLQTGYILKCSISHEIKLHFAHEKKEGTVGSFDLNKGTNRFCLAQPGVYKLRPDSCHKFEKEEYTYDTSNPELLTLTAIQHLVEGIVSTEENVNDITVHIKQSGSESPEVLGPLTAVTQDNKDSKEKSKGSFIYRFSYWARTGENLEFQAKSKELLFSPDNFELSVHGDSCVGEAVKFVGKRGVFIMGEISPPISGVKVTVTSKDGSTQPVTMETQDSGSIKIGPLHSGKEYEVSAEKDGFDIVKEDGTQAKFKATMHGKITVKVMSDNSEPLSTVLLSLSGGHQYRSNNVTDDTGSVTFTGLSVGQYFLRPMMKEYRFDPASQMLEIHQGINNPITIKGVRVAFSCYGSVTSLNGEPEAGVIVEAVGQGLDCTAYQEESKTEPDGTYRIRGLQPKCMYEVRLKPDVNKHIERSAPTSRILSIENSDYKDVDIIAFRRINQMDISGNVVTPDEHLSTLKVRLYKDDNPDSPVHTVSLSTVTFFYLPSVQINNERKSLEQELNQGSFLALPLALLLGYAIYNYQALLPHLKNFYETAKGIAQSKAFIPVGSGEGQSSTNGSGDPGYYSLDPQSQGAKKKNKPRKT